MKIYAVYDKECDECGTEDILIDYYISKEKAEQVVPYHGYIEEIEVIE